MNMIAYVRVSTQDQADSGNGLEAQRNAIAAAVETRGWTIDDTAEDLGISGTTPWQQRPGLSSAICALERGHADGLIVAKLDRLSRSAFDFAHMLQKAMAEDWAIVCLDLGVDTSTPSGKMIAQVMAAFAEFERDMISQRTKEGLAVVRASGRKLGRPVSISGEAEARILREYQAGKTVAQITRDLCADGVPAPLGGATWHPPTVARVVYRTFPKQEKEFID